MISAQISGGGIPTDNAGIEALLKQIADNHPWNQTWWGQLVMYTMTWLIGIGLGWLAGRFQGFKEGIRSERDRPSELSALPPSPPPPFLPASDE